MQGKKDLMAWRERILFVCIASMVLVGFVVLIPSLTLAIREGRIQVVLIDLLAAVVGLSILLLKRLSYRLRAATALSLAYIVGIGVCFSFGFLSGGPAWLFFFAIFAAIFLGLKGALVALFINVFSMTAIGWLIRQGALGPDLAFFKTPVHALVAGVNYILLNGAAAVSVAVLLRGLQEKAEQEETSAKELEREQKELIAAKEILQEEIENRKRTETALRESEERFREMAELMPETIFEMSVGGELTYANQSAFERFGYTQDDFSEGLNALSMIAEEDRSRAAANIQKIVSGERVGITEYTAVRKDGSRFPAIFHSAAIHRGGEVVGLRGFIIDVTERKHLEAQFYQAQRLESIGTLAGGIAHDFNNLLMGIQGRASMVLSDLEPSHPHYQNLKGIEDHVASAAHLTNQLLGFARSGKYEVRLTDINQLVEKSLDMFGRTRKEIRIFRKLEENLSPVEVDRGQIEQVLLNLFVNAWQAMPGGGQLYIETAGASSWEVGEFGLSPEAESYVKISVTDTGTGMDPAVQERIFEPFFTTRNMGRGTGLGLATAYGIIRNHGGTIQVSSKKQSGTTFRVYLPASAKTPAGDAAPVAPAERSGGSETVLLVDDEEMIRDIGSQLLEKLGYRVLTASGGQEAVDLFLQNPSGIDLVILDMIMPGTGGKEVFKQIRAARSDARVLLSSGYSVDGQASEILRQGCDGFIQKPFNLQDLAEKVREILDR
jgi:PAS domain S-box-containing protein